MLYEELSSSKTLPSDYPPTTTSNEMNNGQWTHKFPHNKTTIKQTTIKTKELKNHTTNQPKHLFFFKIISNIFVSLCDLQFVVCLRVVHHTAILHVTCSAIRRCGYTAKHSGCSTTQAVCRWLNCHQHSLLDVTTVITYTCCHQSIWTHLAPPATDHSLQCGTACSVGQPVRYYGRYYIRYYVCLLSSL